MLEQTFICPYCGEAVDTLIDESAGSHRTIEDCRVCCRPVELDIRFDAAGDFAGLEARRDDE